MEEIERRLVRLAGEGSFQGEGGFSLNLKRAISVLPGSQLEKAEEYILRLVSLAVRAGATTFEVRRRSGGLSLSWNGQSFKSEKLARLFGTDFVEDSEALDFVAALLAARQLYAAVKLFANCGSISLEGDSFSFSPGRLVEGATTVLLSRPLGWSRKFRSLPELSILRERCCRASLSWIFPALYKVPRVRIKGSIVRLGLTAVLPCKTLHYRDSDPELGCGYFVLEGRRRQAALVHWGVDYPLDIDFTDAPGRLVWWNAKLKLDLSRSRIVEDDYYFSWRERVRLELEAALRSALSESDDIATESIQEWIMWGKHAGATPGAEKTGDVALRVHALREVCEHNIRKMEYGEALAAARKASDLDPYYGAYEAICLGLLGRFEEAADLYEQVLDLYPEAWIHANYAEDLDLCGERSKALLHVEEAINLQPESPHPIALKAKLICDEDPRYAKSLLLRVLDSSDCPASAWETLAKVALTLDDQEMAVSSLESFIKNAAAETLWENDLPARLLKAKSTLESLIAKDQ